MEAKSKVSVIEEEEEEEEAGCPKCGLMRGEPDRAMLRVHLFLDHHKKRWQAKLEAAVALPVAPGLWEVKCQR